MPQALRQRIRHEAEPTKGSRFVATAAPAADESAARALLAEVAAEWPDASHHCWAWRLATPAIERCGDDGEPGGSAGRPILSVLAGRDLIDTAVVVSRWFGGTKLGVGGLIRAYGGAAAQALDRGVVDDWIELVEISFSHTHGDIGPVEHAIASIGAIECATSWGDLVERRVQTTADQVEAFWLALGDATNGRVRPPAD